MFSSDNTSVRTNGTNHNNSNNICCNNISRVDASNCSLAIQAIPKDEYFGKILSNLEIPKF